jgi:hypothetical protein
MNLTEVQKEFHPSSKVWIYTSSTIFSKDVETQIQKTLDDFCVGWTAHNKELKAAACIVESRFIILCVDEHLNPATGCSIDKSVRILQEIEDQHNINLFDRMLFTYKDKQGNTLTCSRLVFEERIASGEISEDTIVYNTLCNTMEMLNSSWNVPLKDSWMASYFNLV